MEAREYCVDRGQKLAHIVDVEDGNRLVDLAQSAGVSKMWTSGVVKRICSRGTDRSDSCFEWVGSDEPFVGMWRDGEPSSPDSTMACVRLHQTRKMSTESCNERHAFACEADPGKSFAKL
jgi:hypothetical protein